MTSMNIWATLDNPVVWEVSRFGLDLGFKLYRKRINVMKEWGLLKNSLSVVDIGCGIGTYASITDGQYLGVDLNQRYIDYARKRHRQPNQSFRCTDVATILNERSKFDLVLMVDFLHHIPDNICLRLLNTSSYLAKHYIVSFEPITYQPNPLGRWIVKHDRGGHVRSLDKLHQLFPRIAIGRRQQY